MTNVRIGKGRAAVLKALFQAYSRSVRNHVAAIVDRLDVAEELTQEAFLRLLSSDRAHLDSPRGFLFRTARNLALDHVRRARRVPIGRLPNTIWAPNTASAQSGPARCPVWSVGAG